MQKRLPKILTLDAKELFSYCIKEPGSNGPICFDADNHYVFRKVVKRITEFDECPLLDQIISSQTLKKSKILISGSDDWLLNILIILDLNNIFNKSARNEDREADREEVRDDREVSEAKLLREKTKNLMENGFDMILNSVKVHMLPFDKSGNMSRKSRISFINEEYYKELNERLDLIGFKNIEVVLSKYYAYRGLYLTSSTRVYHQGLRITPETLVILSDEKINKVLGGNYEKNVPIISAKFGRGETGCEVIFDEKSETKDILSIETPFDGVGIVSPKYAEYINEALSIKGTHATSFQVRMPFVKGMLHDVDFKSFIKEFDEENWNKETYIIEDAFGKERDLKKAEILLTESMFKIFKWVQEYAGEKNEDPIMLYCDAFEKYEHGMYISSTDLPYGKSLYTHLSYQMLNTLALTDEEFDKLVETHKGFIKDPEKYILGWDPATTFDNDDNNDDYKEIIKYEPSWRTALKKNPDFKNERFIASQIRNTKKGLITKLANGKLVVSGQTRFLCRDLMPLLVSLIEDNKKARAFYRRCLFLRFYMPIDDSVRSVLSEEKNLGYNGFCAFLRSPHLSRNEEVLLQPFEIPQKPEDYFGPPFIKNGLPKYDKYIEYVNLYKKYFGKLTGVVMVPRGSSVPLALGGADFDGDLVSVIFDENVVKAVKRGCYDPDKWFVRTLPIVNIPSIKPKSEHIPDKVPYDHIEKTFSNSIGYLSNKAISIGQKEYGESKKNGKNKVFFDETGPACWKCTILTGLDIDAAKNGKRPDLRLITERTLDISRSKYLIFKNEYERLRKSYDFSFDKMSVSESRDGKLLELASGNHKIKYDLEEAENGTKINRLPVLFKEALVEYKETNTERKEKFSPFFNAVNDDRAEKYIEDCNKEIIKYFESVNAAKRTRQKSNAEENIYNLITRTYEENNAMTIENDILPSLMTKLASFILPGTDIKEMQQRINSTNWMFMPLEKRSSALEEIIGNGFSSDVLTEEEKDLLFCFDQRGFRMLWFIISEIKENFDISYDDIMRSSSIRYRYIKQLRNITDESDLPIYEKVRLMYNLTDTNAEKKRFFWDVFSWDEIDKAITEQKKLTSNGRSC